MSHDTGDFEKQLARLQEIVEELEQGDLALERGVALFKEGSRLAQSCRRQLQEAKHKVQIYSQGILRDFEPEQGEAGHEQDGEAGS